MAAVRFLGWCLLCAVTASCGNDSSPSQSENPGSPEFIEQLARQERSVEDIDICQAITAAGAEDSLADILDVESVYLESSSTESEEAVTQSCRVTTEENQGGDTELSVAFSQGTEFQRAGLHDPIVYPGCRLMDVAPPARFASVTAVRATCEPDLTVDVFPQIVKDSAIPAWTAGPDSKPAEEYVDVMHDVLVAISAQG